MNAALAKKKYTPDDLLRMPEGNHYELVNGELVEQNMSALACFVAGRVLEYLQVFVRNARKGVVFPDGTTYLCFPHDPNRVRKPDVSFIRAEKYSLKNLQEDGHITTVPDLVVEVVSPNDTIYELHERIEDFLKAGTDTAWVLNPLRQTVEIHRRQTQGTILSSGDDLLGEASLSGFRVPVAQLFALPDWLKK
jgi:Uma2 family endonuclease